MAVAPRYKAGLLITAEELWKRLYGDAKVDAYQSGGEAAYYVAKTINEDFVYDCAHLGRVPYNGPLDLFAYLQEDLYVPDHVRHRTRAETLVRRPYGTRKAPVPV